MIKYIDKKNKIDMVNLRISNNLKQINFIDGRLDGSIDGLSLSQDEIFQLNMLSQNLVLSNKALNDEIYILQNSINEQNQYDIIE